MKYELHVLDDVCGSLYSNRFKDFHFAHLYFIPKSIRAMVINYHATIPSDGAKTAHDHILAYYRNILDYLAEKHDNDFDSYKWFSDVMNGDEKAVKELYDDIAELPYGQGLIAIASTFTESKRFKAEAWTYSKIENGEIPEAIGETIIKGLSELDYEEFHSYVDQFIPEEYKFKY